MLMLSSDCLAQRGDSASDVEEEVRALAETYLENLQSFEQMECLYELRKSYPDDEESVLLGLTPSDPDAGGILVCDGSKKRYEVTVTDAVLEQAYRLSRITFPPKAMLLDGERGISYCRDLHGGVLFSSAYPPEITMVTPFDYGRFSGSRRVFHPALILEDFGRKFEVRRPDGQVPEEPHASVGSDELVGIEYSMQGLPADKGSFEFQFFLSPSHGCLPIICRNYGNGLLMQKSVITDIRKVGTNRFFPMRSVNIHYGPEYRVSFAVETRVTSLTVDQPVAASWFQIQVEKGGVLRDGADDNSQFKLSEDQTVRLEDLDDLFQRAADRSKQNAIWAKAREEAAETAKVTEAKVAEAADRGVTTPVLGSERGMALPVWSIVTLTGVVALVLLIWLIRLRTR
jgi:hypothetical protein